MRGLSTRKLSKILLAIVCAASEQVSSSPKMAVGAVRDVTTYGASGSNWSGYASIVAGSDAVSLNSSSDFKPGQGIKIEHAGSPCSLGSVACPPGPSITGKVVGAQGSARYVYQIAVLDELGGVGAASPPLVLSNAADKLDIRKGYNLIRWIPIPSAAGYAIYRDGTLLAIVSGLTPEGYYDPPRGPAFTSTFKDVGLPPVRVPFPDVPTKPPLRSLADSFVTQIERVETAQNLRVKDRPRTTVSDALVTHDDSTAIERAFQAAFSGSQVYFPSGHYRFTRPGFVIRTSLTVQGAGDTNTVLEDNLAGNSFGKWVPPDPCGFLSPVDSNLEVSHLALEGLSAFGSSMTRRKKAICATGSYQHLSVHDVAARNISGEVIYAEDAIAGDVILTRNRIEDSAKNALNTNSASLRNSVITDNVVHNVSGAAILAVSQEATITGNRISGGGLPFGSDVINVATTRFFTIAANEISGIDLSIAATSLLHAGFFGSGLTGGGLIVANSLHDNITANSSVGGAIFVDDIPGTVLIANNRIERLQGCCNAETPAISLAHASGGVLITGNSIQIPSAGGVGIRTEKSVSLENRLSIGKNEMDAATRFSWSVQPRGRDASEFENLSQLAQKWPKPPASH